jgi:hypothetical protein
MYYSGSSNRWWPEVVLVTTDKLRWIPFLDLLGMSTVYSINDENEAIMMGGCLVYVFMYTR